MCVCVCVKSLGIYMGNNDYSSSHPARTMMSSYLALQFKNMVGFLVLKSQRHVASLRI